MLILAVAAWPIAATAQQGAVAERPKRTILVEWATNRFEAELPFREDFNLRGALPEGVEAVAFRYAPAPGQREHPGGRKVWCRSTVLKEKEFITEVGELEPNVPYRFEFTFLAPVSAPAPPVSHGVVGVVAQNNQYVITLHPTPAAPIPAPAAPLPNDDAQVQDSEGISTDRRSASCAAAIRVFKETTPGAGAAASPRARASTARVSGKARAGIQHHFDADFGVMHAFNAEYWGVMTNSHIHLVPINRNESTSELSSMQLFARRASVFVGLAVQPITSEAEVKDLFPVGSPVVGVGYRGLLGVDQLRVNGGVMFFKQDDANPLVARDRHKRDGFVAVTLDFSVQNILAPLAALLK